MKEEKRERSPQNSGEDKETGAELSDESLANAAGGKRWWEWGDAPVNPFPAGGNQPKGEA